MNRAEAPRAAATAQPLDGILRGPVGVAVALFAWLALTAGLRPLALPDEGRYVGIAREMLLSGDWLTPTLDGLPYFHKPPLFYWLTAASMALFGENQAAARAAPILGAWVGGLALYLFVRRWSGDALARRTLVVLATMPLVYGGAQYANMDMLVAGFVTATVLLLAHAVFCLDHRVAWPRGTVVAAYAAAALGVLAKGLIGAALPILVILTWLILTRRARRVLPLLSLPGLAVFLLIAVPWFALLQRRFPGFLDYFFVVQQFQRYAATGFNNVRPFWFYLGVLAVASLPWLPWAGRLLHRRTRPRDPTARPMRGLMLVWAVAVTLFFSIPRSKIPGYIFPALPPLAYFCAEALLAFGPPTRRARRLWAASAAASAALGLAVVIGLTLYPYRSTRGIALTLAHEIEVEPKGGPRPAVFLLGEDHFDLAFYAGLRTPPHIVDDWDTPAVRERDNWRKELADAADFAPLGTASPLVTPAQLPGRLCASPVSWLVGGAGAADRHPFLRQALVVVVDHGTTLWRVDPSQPDTAAALDCAR